MSSRSLGLFLDEQETSRSSLGQSLEERNLHNTSRQKHLNEEDGAVNRNDTGTACSETVVSAVRRASIDSSEWYSTFEPHHSFTAEENAILLRLSQELNGLRQSGIISMVEESTIATIESKRRVSRSIKRLSVASIPEEEISVASTREEEIPVASFRESTATVSKNASCHVADLSEEGATTDTVSKKPCDFCHWLEDIIDASIRKLGKALQGHETKFIGRN